MKIACKSCNELYDYDKRSVLCPHLEFPATKKCLLHNRTECGHVECLNKILQFRQRKIIGESK